MPHFKRYALYAMADGALHDQASAWLGWDSRSGNTVPHPVLDDLPVAELSATPRKYGFHGTIKPPFRLAEGRSVAELQEACKTILPTLQGVHVPRIVVRTIGGFVALVPEKPSEALSALAQQIVERFDGFRAPLNEAELAKRRRHGLTEKQEAYLAAWGYPHVADEFRFHMTLSGRLELDDAKGLAERLETHFEPVIPQPFPVQAMSLLGEDSDGMFHVIDTYALANSDA